MYTSRRSRALSFESLATSSRSNTTTTDTSTIWGPGTLSGKAIEAFGEATLCRPNLYSKNTTQAALRLIMMQITRRETHHLRKGLQKWPVVELQFFLSQIMDMTMHPYENWYVVIVFHLHNVLTLLSGAMMPPVGRNRKPYETQNISAQ